MKYGLTTKQAQINQNKYGSNEISEGKKRTIFNIIIESFADPIIRILLIALAIKMVFMFKDFNWYETLGILIAIFLATLISTISEYGSESAFNKLQEENKEILVKTYRDGVLRNIKSKDIVVDDLIILETGDIIPADAKIISGSIEVDESCLTGESRIINKSFDSESKIYKGTIVYNGSCECIITSVGENTLYGKIAKEIIDTNTVSPLKKRLTSLSKIINKIGYVGAFLVVASYLFSVVVIQNNFDKSLIISYVTSTKIINDLIYSLTLCVTTIVVAVPEGLPMMITLVLSRNMKKMIKNNVLVRKMVGIETAGNINYLLTDKTGTITEGKLSVISYICGDLSICNSQLNLPSNIKDYILESLTYNNASTYSNNEVIGGNPTDKAILTFIKNKCVKKICNYKYIPFSSEKKYSEAIVGEHNYIKGAYDKLIPICSYILDRNGNYKIIDKKVVNKFINSYTKKGYRVIANVDKYQNKTILLGLIIIKDRIRKESIEGIKLIKSSKIKTIMITGDHSDTAVSIAKEVGIITSNEDIVLTSDELNNLSNEEVSKILPNLKVISRSLPTDKSRLVRIIQNSGYVVGMTGDGVNDAPALKCADVGFAMGSGTSVAKEASDIVILDNNLLSISKAILYGRTIFKNIRKFIVYQLSVNFCALFLSIFGPLIGINTPITIVQMLWLNMIMDTFAGLGFSYEPALEKYIYESPLNKNEPIINKNMYIEIFVNGIFGGFLCLIFLKLNIFKNIIGTNKEYFMTAYFALFIFLGIFNAFSSRTEHVNIFKDINKNKVFLIIFIFIFFAQIFIIYFGGKVFSTYGLKLSHLLFTILLASTSLVINTLRKIWTKKGLILQE